MRHRIKKTKFGREGSHNTAMLKNLITSVILYGKVKTTITKAKSVKPQIEKLISLARAVELGKKSKREAIRTFDRELFDKNASIKLIEELGKKYNERSSGFTRIVHLGHREGDAAPMAQIELVTN